jgi:UDP-N-acetylglucosamine:LPS N-acetylglucosamine transferase
MNLLIVSSVGGHLREVMALAPAFEGHVVGLVLNDRIVPPTAFKGQVWYLPHWEREFGFIRYFPAAWRICRSFRPSAIVSAGAGPAVPFGLIGRAMGARVVFLETMTAVRRPSLTGRLMYRLADLFMYQWEELGRCYPGGQCVGPVW